MRALHWPLIAWWKWVQPAAVVAITTVEDATLASDCLVGVGSTRHVVVDTTGEGAVLPFVRSVGLVSGSHSGGGHDR